jgi:hypothetical protein
MDCRDPEYRDVLKPTILVNSATAPALLYLLHHAVVNSGIHCRDECVREDVLLAR